MPRFTRTSAWVIGLTAAAAAISASPAVAIEPAWVGARGGTLGAGAEVGVRVIPTVVVRGVVQGYEFDYDERLDGIDYEGTIDLGSFGAQVDFRPPLIPMFVTVGIYNNDNQLNLTSTPMTSLTVGNTTYTAAELGTVNSIATFDDTAYYGGIGLEFGIGPIAAVIEAGVFYQGDPNVEFTATGPIANDPTFITAANDEAARLVDELDEFRAWPGVTLQARWKF